MELDVEQALVFVNSLFLEQGYKDITDTEGVIFREVWQHPRKKYREIAEQESFEEGSIKTYAYKLWKKISDVLGVKVDRSCLREVVARKYRQQKVESGAKDEGLTPQLFIAHPPSKPAGGNDAHVDNLSRSEKHQKYKKASDLIESVKFIDDWSDLLRVLKAFEIYKQLDEVEMAASLLLSPHQTLWDREESFGIMSYRLGLFMPMIKAINWLIQKSESGSSLPNAAQASLHNINGDLIWMSVNDMATAIDLHKKSQILAQKGGLDAQRLIEASEFNQALCNIDMGDFNGAARNISQAAALIPCLDISLENALEKRISNNCLSAYIQTMISPKGAVELVDKVYQDVVRDESLKLVSAWGKNHLPIYVAKALQRQGNYLKAFNMYSRAQRTAQASGCLQVEGKALMGMANLRYEEDPDSSTDRSITLLLKAKKIFRLINAQGDEAQANVALGKIYRDMGKVIKSKAFFERSSSFYRNRHASNIVRMIDRAIEGHDYCL